MIVYLVDLRKLPKLLVGGLEPRLECFNQAEALEAEIANGFQRFPNVTGFDSREATKRTDQPESLCVVHDSSKGG
jgi:hypothetical protein